MTLVAFKQEYNFDPSRHESEPLFRNDNIFFETNLRHDEVEIVNQFLERQDVLTDDRWLQLLEAK